MQLYDFIHSSASRVVFGIIMGLGLASLFRKTCHGRNCMVFKAPDMAETKKYTFKYDGKCFNYNVNSARCDDSRIDVGLWKIKHNVVSIDDGVIQKHQYFSHLTIPISLHHIPSSSQWTGPMAQLSDHLLAMAMCQGRRFNSHEWQLRKNHTLIAQRKRAVKHRRSLH